MSVEFNVNAGERIPISINWVPWLDGDTIAASSWEVPDVTASNLSHTINTSTVWIDDLIGGSKHLGVAQITTSTGRRLRLGVVIRVK